MDVTSPPWGDAFPVGKPFESAAWRLRAWDAPRSMGDRSANSASRTDSEFSFSSQDFSCRGHLLWPSSFDNTLGIPMGGASCQQAVSSLGENHFLRVAGEVKT